MSRHRLPRLFWTLGALFLVSPLSHGCSKEKKTEAPQDEAKDEVELGIKPSVDLKFKPSNTQKKTIKTLLAQVDSKSWRFPPKETTKKRNAPLFTFIAAASEEDSVISASLAAMYRAYSPHSKKKAMPDDDFVKVVQKHLSSKQDRVVASALLAARTAISGKKADKKLIADVTKMSEKYPHGAGRYAVIDSLRVVSSKNRTPEIVDVFAQSLDDPEAFVVSYALQALYRSTRTIKDQAPVKEKALALAKHTDEGVRGRALELLGALGKDDPKVLEAVLAGLDDSSPYVKAEAAGAISRLRHQPALHKLAKMLDDKTSARYDLKGWTMLNGKPGKLHHSGSAWSFVYDAAMAAMRSLSAGKLKLERVSPKKIEEGLTQNQATAKAWYKKEKAKIPTK